eukprot:TRINITY_DN5423_c0_g1_i1.p1 TRINITY_DN5423_c0_g1~~TRINITY_DN5423_c0_g1_i1.p1  ORF type:complete len:709 (-),score=182.92 TRINITY_DN5423_c0_g1_i1:245-2371(-)
MESAKMQQQLEQLAKYNQKVQKAKKNLSSLEQIAEELKVSLTSALLKEEEKQILASKEAEELRRQLRVKEAEREQLSEELLRAKQHSQRESEEKERATKENRVLLEHIEEMKRDIVKLKRERKVFAAKKQELQAELEVANQAKERLRLHRRTNSEFVKGAAEQALTEGVNTEPLIDLSKELEREKAKQQELEKELEKYRKKLDEKDGASESSSPLPSRHILPRHTSFSALNTAYFSPPSPPSNASLSSSPSITPSPSVDFSLSQALRSTIEISWSDISIERRITGGGFAELFEATYHEERVAVKKLLDQSSVEARKDLLNEVQLLHSLRSGYVVNLYGAVFNPPHMSMILEYFPRGSLGFLLWDKSVTLSWDRRWGFVRDAALALNFLHSRKPPVLHRDIKSGNFLVGEDWRLKITDFGCSVVKGSSNISPLASELPASNSTIHDDKEKQEKSDFQGGTINWTAPEVLDGKEYTEKADAYSYSMLLYEIVTREIPWKEYSAPRDQLQIKKKVCDGQRPFVPSDIPAEMRTLMTSCWEQSSVTRWGFREAVKFLRKKGMMKGASSRDEAVERLVDAKAKIEEEVEAQKRLRSKLESRQVELEKMLETEKQRQIELSNELRETNAKYDMEIQSMKALEKLKDDQTKRLEARVLDLEKKRDEGEALFKAAKKKISKLKKDVADIEAQKEELEKKLVAERRRSVMDSYTTSI